MTYFSSRWDLFSIYIHDEDLRFYYITCICTFSHLSFIAASAWNRRHSPEQCLPSGKMASTKVPQSASLHGVVPVARPCLRERRESLYCISRVLQLCVIKGHCIWHRFVRFWGRIGSAVDRFVEMTWLLDPIVNRWPLLNWLLPHGKSGYFISRSPSPLPHAAGFVIPFVQQLNCLL
ncbi:unnamed protein product [Protopolystoma xenopodis]|uniref:Uncharacterized protein n=1 Tax=Protopolystoma xenopodis TaxID=117903 RepID=A0A448X0Z7_9PLAT|nr:unnamed protein product [Protopolystoma xenopodis]